MGLSFSFGAFLIISTDRTGTRSSETNSEPKSADETVTTIGEKSLYSMPSNPRIGMYTTVMMAMPKRIGLKTSLAEASIIAWVLSLGASG